MWCNSQNCCGVQPSGAGTQAALSVLLECAAKHNLYGIRKGHRGQTRIYALQGVNRVNVPVAYDMASPMEYRYCSASAEVYDNYAQGGDTHSGK